jgi:ABC-type branched-subunit amino acid transport system substrate-binding protein
MRTHRPGPRTWLTAVAAVTVLVTASCGTTATQETSEPAEPSSTASASAVPASSPAAEPGPGVSDTEIVIGLETNLKSQENQGGTGLQVPSAAEQVPILVDQINAAGGINGRTITIVTADFDPSQPTAPQENAACNTFTQDNQVFAVLALRSDATDAYLTCLQDAGTILIASSPTQPVTTEILAAHPGFYAPQTMSLSRFAPAYVTALSDSGFFTDGKLGVLVSADNPTFQTVYDSVMAPALEAVGATPVYVGSVPDDFARAGDAAATELPKMAEAGVDRLMALEPNGIGIGTFIAGGAAGGFTPKATMSTFDTPDPVRTALPPGTLTGVTGFAFGSTVDDSEVDSLNPTAQKCIADLTAGGQQIADSNGRGVSLVNCAGVWFLADALANVTGVVNADSFSEGALALGTDYESPWGSLDMTLDGRTGQHQFTPFEYKPKCNCFVYGDTPIDVTG